MVIVAAVDRSDRAEIVAREGETLAEAFDEKLHIVYALSRSEFVALGSESASSGEAVDMDQIRGAARNVAQDAITDLSCPHEYVGLVGDAAKMVVNYAEDEEARYIVIGGRKRSPAGKAIFGSVSQSILLSAACPVVSTLRDADE